LVIEKYGFSWILQRLERSKDDFYLMALEIIEWFFAIIANIQGFAGCRTKFTYAMCVPGVAMWALDGLISK
jgi:hypothetical protein